MIRGHLEGKETIGVYPLLEDHTCWFLACDFDKQGWILDAVAFLRVCRRYGIPAYLERSRSGNGGHVWIFFSERALAASARQLGIRLLRETMVFRGEMDLASYDRFFPSQDFSPKGGFGNLIALPLQKQCRVLGNTEFLNPGDAFQPWPDQWVFLSRIQRLSRERLEGALETVPPVLVGSAAVMKVSREVLQNHPPPPQIRVTLSAALAVEKSVLPPWMLAGLKHLASLHNPQFYERQKLRLSTFRIPKFIRCYDEDDAHLFLPRGIREDAEEYCRTAGSKLLLKDERRNPEQLKVKFHGRLLPNQQKVMRSILRHETGVLVAPPGAGKTVMGCYAIAKRNVPTLILAHRKPILEQWRRTLMETLDLTSRQIGQVGGGRRKLSRTVDLGMLQSLKKIEDLEAFFSEYGFLIIDECHHIPAVTFEACLKRASVRHILGLTATPYRRDGLQEIICMQCGPIRFQMQDRDMERHPRRLIVRESPFVCPAEEGASIQDVFREMTRFESRNRLIQNDVDQAVSEGRRCLVLSQWRDHCRLLAEGLSERGIETFSLHGLIGKKARVAALESIQAIAEERGLAVVSTGQYLGEGFDCPRIDTLFLAFPVSFKGRLVQYVGRIMRACKGKTDAAVYDYVDARVPVLKGMYLKRTKTYKTLGFHEETFGAGELFERDQ